MDEGLVAFYFCPLSLWRQGYHKIIIHAQRANGTNEMLLMDEIGIGGPCYRIFNHILRRSYFALPREPFACNCSNILCENGAEESKYRNLAEFMETYITANITITG
jgi:hypothetical protein